MAHSLRSKSKIRAKAIKTQTKDYKNLVENRSKRLSEKLVQNTLKQKIAKAKAENGDAELADSADVMEEDQKDLTKVSTSGWRKSRNSNYKQSKSKKSKGIHKF